MKFLENIYIWEFQKPFFFGTLYKRLRILKLSGGVIYIVKLSILKFEGENTRRSKVKTVIILL